MTRPSFDEAREILRDTAARARAAGGPYGEMAASAVEVVLDRVDDLVRSLVVDSERRATVATTSVVPFLDEHGRRIGYASLDGAKLWGVGSTMAVRVTDHAAAAALRASTGPVGVSLGYSVDAACPPEGTHDQECASHVPGGECTCPATPAWGRR